MERISKQKIFRLLLIKKSFDSEHEYLVLDSVGHDLFPLG